MKFIKLESRGGNYLVVAENVAWLRTAENGQTSVGIIGGQPLLVVGSVEEVAAKILAGAAPDEPEAEATPPEPPVAAPASVQPASAPAVETPPAPPEPAPASKPQPEPVEAVVAEPVAEIVTEPPEPEPQAEPAPAPQLEAPAAAAPPPVPPPVPAPRPRAPAAEVVPLAQRIARANRSQVKGGSQRFMSALD